MTTCRWCEEPATTTVRTLPACALCAAIESRKNTYMPCVINADYDAMTPVEQARVLRATKWADNITNGEWPVVLGVGTKAPTRSKLKKKATGWLMALSRIVRINPKLGGDVLRAADALYREQVREPPPVPWAAVADVLDADWDADAIAAWLQPLGNLRSFHPGDLEGVVEELVKRRDAWVAR